MFARKSNAPATNKNRKSLIENELLGRNRRIKIDNTVTTASLMETAVSKTFDLEPKVKKRTDPPKQSAANAPKRRGFKPSPPRISGPLPKNAPSIAITIPTMARDEGRSPWIREYRTGIITEREEIGDTTPIRPVASPAKNALRPIKPISPAHTPGRK